MSIPIEEFRITSAIKKEIKTATVKACIDSKRMAPLKAKYRKLSPDILKKIDKNGLELEKLRVMVKGPLNVLGIKNLYDLDAIKVTKHLWGSNKINKEQMENYIKCLEEKKALDDALAALKAPFKHRDNFLEAICENVEQKMNSEGKKWNIGSNEISKDWIVYGTLYVITQLESAEDKQLSILRKNCLENVWTIGKNKELKPPKDSFKMSEFQKLVYDKYVETMKTQFNVTVKQEEKEDRTSSLFRRFRDS